MTSHHKDAPAFSSSVHFQIRGSLGARLLRRLSAVSTAKGEMPTGGGLLPARSLPLVAVGAGALLAMTSVVAAPVPVFSMMLPATALLPATPLQAPAAGGQTTPAGTSLDATDTAGARGHLGEFVEIKGTPTGSGASKSGAALYLNFSRQRGGAVTVVFFLPKGNATPASGAGTRPTSVDDLKQFIGKPVTVKGQLSDYQGDVQMVVPYLEQIKAQ